MIARPKSYTLQEKNIALMDAVRDIFGPRRLSLRRQRGDLAIEGKQVKEFYDLITKLWPKEANIFSELDHLASLDDGQRITGLLYGSTGTFNSNSISRLGLHVDRMLMADVFLDVHSPMFIAATETVGYGGLVVDTQSRVRFLQSVEEWIRSGDLILFPNPEWYHREYRNATADFFKANVDDFVLWWVKKMADENEISPPREITVRRKDNNDGETRAVAQIFQQSGDFHTLQAITTAHAIGGIPITDDYVWNTYQKYLMSRKIIEQCTDYRQDIARAFMKLDLQFLDNVRPDIVHRFRKDQERLKDFRSFLRKTWNKINNDKKLDLVNIESFEDELREEYRKQKGEWDVIKGECAKWTTSAGGAAALSTYASPAIATGHLAPFVIIGAGLVTISQMIDSYIKTRKLKRSGTSIFVELSEHRRLLSRL